MTQLIEVADVEEGVTYPVSDEGIPVLIGFAPMRRPR